MCQTAEFEGNNERDFPAMTDYERCEVIGVPDVGCGSKDVYNYQCHPHLLRLSGLTRDSSMKEIETLLRQHLICYKEIDRPTTYDHTVHYVEKISF